MTFTPVLVQQGCEPDHSPSSSTDINNEWSCSLTPSICHYGVYRELGSRWSSRPLHSQRGVHVLGKIKISRPSHSRREVFQSSTSKPIPCTAEVIWRLLFSQTSFIPKGFPEKWFGVCMTYPFMVCKEFHYVKILINISFALFLLRVLHVLIS